MKTRDRRLKYWPVAAIAAAAPREGAARRRRSVHVRHGVTSEFLPAE